MREDPTGSLKLSVMAVEKPLGERGVGEAFEEVKTLLFEAIKTIVNSILHPGSSRLYIIVCVSTIIGSQTVLSSRIGCGKRRRTWAWPILSLMQHRPLVDAKQNATFLLSTDTLLMDPRPPLPSVQSVYKIVRRGDPAKALVRDDSAPVPVNILKGQVLVKIQAVSLNPVCVLLSFSHTADHNDLRQISLRWCPTFLSGYKLMRLLPNSLLGRIAESDFAGEIVNPNGCDRFKAGDQVFGTISLRVSFRPARARWPSTCLARQRQLCTGQRASR